MDIVTDREFDMLLKKSVELYGDTYFEKEAPEHDFSSGFNKKMDSLIRRKNNTARIIRIFAGAAAVIVIGAAVGIFAMTRNSSFKLQNTSEANIAADNAATTTDEQKSTAASTSSEAPYTERNTDKYEAEKGLTNNIQNGAAVSDDHSYSTKDSMAEAPAAAQEDTQDAVGEQAEDTEKTDSAVCTGIIHNGTQVSAGSETAKATSNYICALISGSGVSYDTKENTSPVSDEQAEYSFRISSVDSQPVAYDENGQPYYSITVNLLSGRGSVTCEESGETRSFTLNDPQQVRDALKALVG